MLADVTRELVPPRRRPDEETLSAVLGGRVHRDTEVGDDQVSLIVRAIPLRARGEHVGALVLVRDVTDLRRRDRELVTKDATIREIHHRVKNNLQTVAALLRLQARRIELRRGPSWPWRRRSAGSGSIAIVHETLSQEVLDEVAFDEIADRLGRDGHRRRAGPDGRATGPSYAGRGRSGCCPTRRPPRWRWCSPSCCRTPSSTAIPRSPSTGGHDRGRARSGSRAGCGSPSTTTGSASRTGFDLDTSLNLGLSIVRTLVESELGGLLELRAGPGRGARAVVDVPLEVSRCASRVRRCARGRGSCDASARGARPR